jgi:two-component system, sensor histidine kinase RegB
MMDATVEAATSDVAMERHGRLRALRPVARADGDRIVDVTAAPPRALRAGIHQLMHLRSLAIAGQSAAIAVSWALGVALPLVPMAVIVGVLIVVNVTTFMRLRTPHECTHADIAANLALDLAALTTLLFLSGGASNPFSLLYVLHVVLIALLLPASAAACGTLVVVLCYIVLGQAHYPLELTNGAPLPQELRTFGLAASLAVTAAFSAWFVARITGALRDHERRLSEAVHRALRDDAVLRVGALAAGAAHELASPLNTMAVLAEEIERSCDSATGVADARQLRAQLAVCRETITNLMAAAGHIQSAGGGRQRVDTFLDSIADACRTTRPGANLVCEWSALADAPPIIADHSLKQALLVLLNNAVDASPDDVRFTASLSARMLRIIILDRGAGVPAADMAKLGRAFFTTKPPGKGAGLGVVVASRAIERLGGSLRFQTGAAGGMQAEVALPFDAFRIGEGSR